MEYESVKEKLSGVVTKDKRCKCNKFKDEDCYVIGKYVAIHGTAAALRKFKKLFLHRLTESTVRAIREIYHRVVKSPSSSLIKKITLLKRGRPLLLGSLDEKVQKFSVALRSKGGVVNTIVAVAVAKALIEKSSDELLKVLDLDNSSWVKRLFVRMGFVKRACTTARPEIPEGVRKESELIFHHEITSLVERYSIPSTLSINIDQTPLKYAPVSSRTMATKNSKHVHVAGFSYKQAITGTFGITLSNKFLPMQLIYGGKTVQSLPKFKFPESFSLSANPKYFSNTTESLKLLDEIIIPYVKNERERLKLEPSQPALLILDVLSGQMTTPATDKVAENRIKYVKVPANMTNLFQPLDLTINRSPKAFMKKKFTEWYSLEVMKQHDSGKSAEEIEVKLLLSKLKPLHASWVIELYNHFT